MCVQLYVSIRDRELTRDIGGDPWNARTLEWATPSPVPSYNFPVIPHIHALDAFAVAKEAGFGYQEPVSYSDIHLPGATYIGVITAVFGTALGVRPGLVHVVACVALLRGHCGFADRARPAGRSPPRDDSRCRDQAEIQGLA